MSMFDLEFSKLSSELQDLLKNPSGENELLPKSEKLFELLHAEIEGSENLQRYHKIKERMSKDKESYIIPPNYIYSLHTV